MESIDPARDEKQYIAIQMIDGETRAACTASAPGWPRPLAILMPCPFRLYRMLNGWWSVYEIEFPKDKPIRLKLTIASERHEQACGRLSRRYIDPSPAILLLIADSLERSSRGGGHGRRD
jgi:hypothetical protein